jgi:hypothetical protein
MRKYPERFQEHRDRHHILVLAMSSPLQASDIVSQAQMEASRKTQPHPVKLQSIHGGMLYAIYAVASSASPRLVAMRAPPWLDETVSFFLIRGGFAGIMSRQVWPDSPVESKLSHAVLGRGTR